MSEFITEVDIREESKDCFLTYGSEVLTDRAIPSAEDGLLSAQRKILWTMEDFLKMNSKSKTKKCNAVVGSTLSTSYFHGDQACYGVLCKMAQGYLMRYPLIRGQGSLGTQENNEMCASSRYCMTGDSLIPTNNGTVKIEEIVKNSQESSEHNIDLDIIGFDGKIHHASKLFNSGKYPIVEITLQNGMNIKVTENHPLMVLDENLDFSWRLAGYLKENDKILLLAQNDAPLTGKRNDYLEAAMLGSMISEGYATTKNRIGINNQDIEMIAPVVEYTHREVPTCTAKVCENIDRGYYEFCFSSKEFYPQFIQKFEFEKSLNKRLPKQYFEGDLKYKATLLKYLFEGDGSVDLEHGITYSSISEELIHQLQISLIQDFGIISTIRKTSTRNEIKLCINDIYSERFKEKIDFVSVRKRDSLNALVKKYNNQKVISNCNMCNIYEVTEYVRKKYSGRYFTQNGFSNKKSYAKLKGHISEEDYSKIKNLVENYVYLKIKMIEHKPDEVVYSLKIDDESHAYIGNGFINHNTEAAPSVYADLMMQDFSKGVVPLKETYNGEYMEPVVLPGLFPNALCNGKQAIGLSMAHNSLPNNLSEVCDAIVAYIKNDDMTIDELMTHIKGPDFPLPNIVLNSRDIRAAFATGHSAVSLKVRGVHEVNGQTIVFTSIPYRTYRNKIKEQIEKNIDVFDGLLDDFNDESSLGQNRLVFKVKRGISVDSVLNKLFALTDLQTTLSYNMNYIVDGTPRMCSMLDLIDAYVKHQTNVLIKATEYDKDKAEKRAHILEGLLIVLKDIDEAIKLIKESQDTSDAKRKLMDRFILDEIQAKAVLDMRLGKLTKLDKEDLLKELEQKRLIIAECNKIINEKPYRDEKLIGKVSKLKADYGDERRTQLLDVEIIKEKKVAAAALPEDVVVTITQTGAIKRVPVASFKVQKKGGKGLKSADDVILDTIKTNTLDTLMYFTNKGKMYRTLVSAVPSEKAAAVSNIVKLEPNEKVMAISSLHRTSIPKHIVFVTKGGMIKKSLLEEYTKTNRNTGVAAIKLKEGDELVDILFMDDEDVIIISKNGMAIRFSIKDIGASGKNTLGVIGMKLTEGDSVVSVVPVHKDSDTLATFTASGLGKKMDLSNFMNQSRGGKGLIIYPKNEEEVIGAAMVSDDDMILLNGMKTNICFSAKDIPLMSRSTKGNMMIKGTRAVSVTKI